MGPITANKQLTELHPMGVPQRMHALIIDTHLGPRSLGRAADVRRGTHAIAAGVMAIAAIFLLQLGAAGAATRRATVQVSARVNPIACPAGAPKVRSCVYPVRKLEATPSSDATGRNAPTTREAKSYAVAYRVLEY